MSLIMIFKERHLESEQKCPPGVHSVLKTEARLRARLLSLVTSRGQVRARGQPRMPEAGCSGQHPCV